MVYVLHMLRSFSDAPSAAFYDEGWILNWKAYGRGLQFPIELLSQILMEGLSITTESLSHDRGVPDKESNRAPLE
jgi:hypothetical protein